VLFKICGLIYFTYTYIYIYIKLYIYTEHSLFNTKSLASLIFMYVQVTSML